MLIDLSAQKSGTEINNEDITVLTNGEYTASEGYTGLGTVTVNVPASSSLQKNCFVVNANVDSNGIASDFGATSGSYSLKYGGIAVPYYPEFADLFISSSYFQIKFKTPAEAWSGWEVVTGTATPNNNWGSYGAGNDLIVQIPPNLTNFKFFGFGVNGRTVNYAMALDTWYIFQFKTDGVYVSTDDGETFTKISGDSIAVNIQKMKETQIGFSADWQAATTTASNCSVDLKKTGYINTSTGYSYMFAE